MGFQSILYEQAASRPVAETSEAPEFFIDLNLDQVIEAITAGKQEYNLKPFYYVPLHDVGTIRYRHEVMQDLERKEIFAPIEAFGRAMRTMREHIAQAEKLHYKRQKQSWFVDAVATYCSAVSGLAESLGQLGPRACGLLSLRAYLAGYIQTTHFTALVAATEKISTDLAAVEYCLHIKGSAIRVRLCESERDFSAEVEETFAKFQLGAVKDYTVAYTLSPDMNHVEAQILDKVALLFPDLFGELDDYCAHNGDYLDETIRTFDREIQFYIAYLDYMAIFRRWGLSFCYPEVSATDKEVCGYATYDAALGYKLIREEKVVVCNDFQLRGKERIFVVSGPNQGGKTTFARTFGQLHYLASLGCPVPGTRAHLFLYDSIYTHFEAEEDINNLRGKLEDELVRIHAILRRATPRSIVIVNEIFTSTTLSDAIFLGKKVMEALLALDLLGVCVTFIDELSTMSEKTVSMVSTVDSRNTAQRTYKILRKPADGLSYAISIAEKYGVTYSALQERIPA